MRRCASNFCPYFGEASEFATNVQRRPTLLAHTQRVHIAYAKIRRIRAHPGCLWKVWEKDQHRESLDYYSLAQKHCRPKSERFMLIPYRRCLPR